MSGGTVTYATYAGSAAENYERYFVPAIGEPLARDLVERAALRAGERVLDVACGTGVVTRLAADAVGPTGSVAGLDLNPGMLAVARAATPAGVTVDWHQSSAEAMPLPDGAFDAVLCQMGLQFMDDAAAAVREMGRVLAPGGRVVLSTPGPTPPPMVVMAEALGTHVAREIAGFVHVVFSLHEPEALRELLEGAGLGDVVVDRRSRTLRVPPPKDFLWQYVHSTPMADPVLRAGDDALAALERDMVSGCAPYVDDKGALIVEVGMLTAVARRG